MDKERRKTYLSRCASGTLRVCLFTTFPAFFAMGRRGAVLRGVDVLEELEVLEWAAVPPDFAMARILKMRSFIARGVGAARSLAV